MAASTLSSTMHQGRYCVAFGRDGFSCGNGQYTPGLSIHCFPNREKYPERFEQWVQFVRRHRPYWNSCSKQPVLCGLHFEESCFNARRDIARSVGLKHVLNKDAIPTIEVARQSPIARRELRLPEMGEGQEAIEVSKDTGACRCRIIEQGSYLSSHELAKACVLGESAAQHGKEGQVSNENVVENSSDDKDQNRKWYPSECTFKDWRQGKEETNEREDEMNQGLSVDESFARTFKEEPVSDEEVMQGSSDEERAGETWDANVPVEQLLLSKPCKQEPVSDEDFIGSTSDKEDRNITWYSSDCVLDNWREGEDATEREKNRRHDKLCGSAAVDEELNKSTPSGTDSAQCLSVVHSFTKKENPVLKRKRRYSKSSIAEMKEPNQRLETELRRYFPTGERDKSDAEAQLFDADNLACTATTCTYRRICFSMDFIRQHEKKCRSKISWKRSNEV